MSKIIAVVKQKGRVAKTTTAIHIGVALGELGKKVLLVDLDPQGHIAEQFGMIADDIPQDMSDVFQGVHRITDIIMPNIRPNVDIAPANDRMTDMEITLVNIRFRETRLKRGLEPVTNLYDYILLDCPPNLGLFTVNALIASNAVLIPMETKYLAMRGVARLLKNINNVKQEANPDLAILGIIPTRFTHTIHAREAVKKTQEELGKLFHIFPSVNESTRFGEASEKGKTIYEHAPDVVGGQIYRQIAKEIIYG